MKNLYDILPEYQQMIDEMVKKNLLSDIEFVYKGFHNYTFKARYKGNKFVQLRVPSSKLVDHDTEEKYYLQDPDCLFYKKGLLIRKWFEGKTLETVPLTEEIQKMVIKELKQFHKQKLDVNQINWNKYDISDPKFLRIIEKIQDKRNVVIHGDLALKNILINDKKQVKLLDLEWVRKAHVGFDVLSLYQIGFDKKLLKKEFRLTEKEFEDLEYVTDLFREYSYKNTYCDFLKNSSGLKKIETGFTNESFVFNDKFIQQKNYTGFNHLNDEKIFNNHDFAINTLYEDEYLLVKDFVHSRVINIENEQTLELIARTLKNFHNSDIEVADNNILQRIEHLFFEYKFHPILNDLSEELKTKIIENFKDLKPEVVSHNDLNITNILLTKDNKIKFIDLEYVCKNSKYFDIAYLMSNLNFDDAQEKQFIEMYDSIVDFNEYYRIKCLVNFYTLLWSLDINDDWDLSLNIDNIKKYSSYLK
ncbi:phosphotransferase [[Mycoplasma] gypis]|uniref:Phosphotransferase n=1 Tax=[Mycoplasma] gypis TaxID=92404 RepID=A0ABZ2RPS3_9BACT|nr:phosphotransferase [[Mycoplasma] gypis]MBN0919625.1 phosphotransferase [[Mycoplasma] gypis]